MASEIKRRFTDTEMQIAKEADLPELLTHLGYQVRRIGRYHTTAEMDSLRIKDRRKWFRYSQNTGGDAITFLQQFCGKSFPEAVEYLLTFHGKARDAPVPQPKPVSRKQEFSLPTRNADDRRVFAYLRKRGIAAQVIRQFLNAGLLYEDAVHHNCVFVGKNSAGQVKYQAISDALNRQGVPYCREVPLWNKHKVKRLLENPRYTGKEGYPILVEADIFQTAQEKTAEKNARRRPRGGKPAIARLTSCFRCTCGGKMARMGGGWQNSGKLYLRCEGCGTTAVTDMEATVSETVRQFREHEQPSCTAYTPSAEVMRLDNAINRGLEQPDSPEAVMALILQGAAARYACCPEPSAESNRSERLTETDWRRFQRAVSHITISQDAEVTLIFTDKKATGKDE